MDQIFSSGVTRRALLEHLGRIGSTAAVFAATNSFGVPLASVNEISPNLRGFGKSKKVLVLAAGYAGNTVTFAHELSNLGYNVTVLEAHEFASGRAHSACHGFAARELR